MNKDLIAICKAKGLSLACAESCTGGLIAASLTSVPGASAVFRGGVVSYSEEVKQSVLGVPGDVLAKCGVVSHECAQAMASGVRRLLASSLACSTTGWAGPDGGTAEDPVGTVYFGIASEKRVQSFRRVFKGNRDDVRRGAVEFAISLLLTEAQKF